MRYVAVEHNKAAAASFLLLQFGGWGDAGLFGAVLVWLDFAGVGWVAGLIGTAVVSLEFCGALRVPSLVAVAALMHNLAGSKSPGGDGLDAIALVIRLCCAFALKSVWQNAWNSSLLKVLRVLWVMKKPSSDWARLSAVYNCPYVLCMWSSTTTSRSLSWPWNLCTVVPYASSAAI
jgi:hypothetical protein